MGQVLHGSATTTEVDNIVVAIDSLPIGQPALGVAPDERVRRGHKMAVQAIARDAPMVKYGQVIGYAKPDIAPGTGCMT